MTNEIKVDDERQGRVSKLVDAVGEVLDGATISECLATLSCVMAMVAIDGDVSRSQLLYGVGLTYDTEEKLRKLTSDLEEMGSDITEIQRWH